MSTIKRGNSILASYHRKKRIVARVKKRKRDDVGRFKKMSFVENYKFNSITLPWED